MSEKGIIILADFTDLILSSPNSYYLDLSTVSKSGLMLYDENQ